MKRGLSVLVLLPAMLWMSSCGSTGPSPVITINPTGASLNVNTTQQFTATIQNLSSTLVNWEVNGTVGGSLTAGTITTGGLYTAPATVPSGSLNVVTVTAVAQAQTSLTAAASVTIVPAAAIVISPTTATVSAGTNFSFLATVGSSALNTGVTWEVNGIVNGNSTIGTVSGGLYTAPLIPPAGGTVTVTAVEQNDATQTASAAVTITLGTATIQGAYTFSMSGVTATGPFARAGYFITGANGTINGREDLNLPGLAPSTTQFSGLYSVGNDGRGTMQFCESNGANSCTPALVTSNYRILVLSTQQVQIIPFDSNPNAVGTGEANSWSTSLQFGPTDLSGCYTFDFSGTASATTAESVVGYFCADGKGNIVAGGPGNIPGELDVNLGGVATKYTLNNSTYSLATNNRGTLSLAASGGPTLNLSFYMVSPGRAKFVENDSLADLSGDAFTQATILPWGVGSLNAAVIFKVLGSGPSGGMSNLARIVPDGSGNILPTSLLDQNYSGTITSGSVAGAYTLDATGRGTLTLNSGSTNSYIFYMIAPNSAVIEQVGGFVAHGTILPQTGGPFTSVIFNGSYGLNLTGLIVGSNTGEVILGQLSVAASPTGVGGSMSGALDINDFTLGPLTVGEPNTGVFTSVGGATGRATINLNPSADNRNFVMYFVSPTQAFVLGTDRTRLSIGSITRLF